MKTKLFLGLVFASLLNLANTYGQEPEDCSGQFKTFTIGGWGTECHGGNPGCYRDSKFADAFPGGLTIGCGANTITLTSSLAVQNFLPSGGTPDYLDGALVDPLGDDVKNTLASQLIGVTLAVGFDAADPNFSSSGDAFGALEILSGPFAGMTVSEFLDYANQVIGGCISGDLTDLNETATNINENYDNGNVDNGFLDCNPCPNCARFDFIITSTNAVCNGESTGTITITTSGGTAPYTYFLDDVPVAVTNDSFYVFEGLAAGTYVVAVNDSAGNSGSSDPTITITEPDPIAATLSKTDVSCFEGSDGTVTIDSANISGGTGPFTFEWFDGSTSDTVTGLPIGTYSVTVTDSEGCTAEFSITIEEPDLLGYTSSLTDVSCFGGSDGSATITPTGGTEPYSILWDDNSTSFTRDGLSANINYTAVITDGNGCTANVSVSVTQPTALTVVTVTTQAACLGGSGSATATASGGTEPYSYSWNTDPVQLSDTASLPVGTWTVTVTDGNGCIVSANVTITVRSCQGFTTVTMGGYGAKCAGGNWGCYVKNNFAAAFPLGLTIGANGRFLKLTSATAVQDFLPSGSIARALNVGTLINPTEKSYNNVLAGQTVALTLSVQFDITNPNFSSSSTLLGDLVVGSGPFVGLTVNQLLVIANNILGNVASPYTASQINDALNAVNNNYDGGTTNNGYLVCPCLVDAKPISDANEDFGVKYGGSIVVYPNPIKGSGTLDISINYSSKVVAEVYNVTGQRVGSVLNDDLEAGVKYSVNINAQGNGMKAGVYFLRVMTDREVFKKTIMINE